MELDLVENKKIIYPIGWLYTQKKLLKKKKYKEIIHERVAKSKF